MTEVESSPRPCRPLRFDDGSTRERDLSPLLTGSVFEQIRDDESTFRQIKVDPSFGVTWPNGADVDTELLRYDDLWGQAIALARPA